MSEVLEAHQEKRLLRLTLNRPEKRNALNLSLCRELVGALERADDDPSVGAVLLTGSGKAFCSGMDLSEVLQADRSDLDDIHERLFTAGFRLRKPIIAGVHGPALAGGTGLAANAHILVASEEASFGLTEIRIGLWPILIFRAVKAAMGERRAVELALTGRIFGGREALSLGLVHEVSDDPLVRAAEIALQISQLSADAIRSGLEYVNRTRDQSWEEAGRTGGEVRRVAMASPDFKEGVGAFLRKKSGS
jgi:enoyl-CoA hydratase/carnithine racemase